MHVKYYRQPFYPSLNVFKSSSTTFPFQCLCFIGGLTQDFGIFIVSALEIPQSYTEPSVLPAAYQQLRFTNMYNILKKKCHFYKSFVLDCAENCHFDKFQYSQWWKFWRHFRFSEQGITTQLNHIDVLVQDCSNFSANALELLQSCTKPWIRIHLLLYHVCVHVNDVPAWLCDELRYTYILDTVPSFYNMVSSLQNTHNRHPIAHLWGWDMGYLMWVQSPCIVFIVVLYAIHVLCLWDCVIFGHVIKICDSDWDCL